MSCKDCKYYDREAIKNKSALPPEVLGHLRASHTTPEIAEFLSGRADCMRYPETVRKFPQEECGEYVSEV